MLQGQFCDRNWKCRAGGRRYWFRKTGLHTENLRLSQLFKDYNIFHENFWADRSDPKKIWGDRSDPKKIKATDPIHIRSKKFSDVPTSGCSRFNGTNYLDGTFILSIFFNFWLHLCKFWKVELQKKTSRRIFYMFSLISTNNYGFWIIKK
jgi:hypothetical protein